jgi:hypothetical protein
MNNQELVQKILHHVGQAQEGNTNYESIYVNSLPDSAKHEFLFFIKPEITLNIDTINFRAILEMMFEKLGKYELRIRDVVILGATYLEKFDIIAQHYGVINAMSRRPLEHLTSDAVSKFRAVFGKSTDQVKLLGSLEFLQHFPDFTPLSLDDLWQSSQTVKLAGGTYCAMVTVNGEEIYLINGFHPRQLIHFTEKGRSIIAFTLAGELDWSVARNGFIGKTNPADALPGSLRNELLINQEKYGLESVSASQNGFHLSAGPVEGLVELIRYCSDYSEKRLKSTGDFVFGRQLKQQFSDEEIRMICKNHVVDYQEKRINVFDLTEERNSSTALELLRECHF